MIKDIYDYFVRLEQQGLPMDQGCFVYDDKRITDDSLHVDIHQRNLTIDGVSYFNKPMFYEHSLAEIASTNMYNAIGIPTPPVYAIKDYMPYWRLSFENNHLMTPSVHEIDEYEFVSGRNVFNYFDKSSMEKYDRWDVLTNAKLKKLFLKRMTPECFDSLIALTLADEVRSETDRHLGNMFFYRKWGEKLYSGVIPIDNEILQLLIHEETGSPSFDQFIKTKYSTHNPICIDDQERDYESRIKVIKNLIHKGLITAPQIELLRREISYDFPKEIENAAKGSLHVESFRKKTTDSVARLWDYHQKDLGRELGL